LQHFLKCQIILLTMRFAQQWQKRLPHSLHRQALIFPEVFFESCVLHPYTGR